MTYALEVFLFSPRHKWISGARNLFYVGTRLGGRLHEINLVRAGDILVKEWKSMEFDSRKRIEK